MLWDGDDSTRRWCCIVCACVCRQPLLREREETWLRFDFKHGLSEARNAGNLDRVKLSTWIQAHPSSSASAIPPFPGWLTNLLALAAAREASSAVSVKVHQSAQRNAPAFCHDVQKMVSGVCPGRADGSVSARRGVSPGKAATPSMPGGASWPHSKHAQGQKLLRDCAPRRRYGVVTL